LYIPPAYTCFLTPTLSHFYIALVFYWFDQGSRQERAVDQWELGTTHFLLPYWPCLLVAYTAWPPVSTMFFLLGWFPTLKVDVIHSSETLVHMGTTQ
jgi:hypothetical protein